MNNLIRDYFKRDLTDGEVDALEQLLETSEEARQAFLTASEQAYRHTGLPEPQLPGQVISFKSKWLIPALAAAAVVVAAGSIFYLNQKPAVQSGTNPITASTTGLAGQSAQQGSKAFGSIAFQVNMKDLHVVTVRVEDANNQEVIKLFSGLLAPGAHDFSWNKCFQNGSPVPKGEYSIVVEHAGALPKEHYKVQVN